MGLFDNQNKTKEDLQGTDLFVPYSTLCNKCLRKNKHCPYGNQPSTTINNGRGVVRSNDTCDAYTASVKEPKNQSEESSLECSMICGKCFRNNNYCPYGNQPSTTINNGRGVVRNNYGCDAYVDFVNAKYLGNSVIQCPRCGSHDIGKRFDRFECKVCGRLFS
jgi:hypothetical protein